MIPDNLLNSLYCSLSGDNWHIIEKPFCLSCGHSACAACIGDGKTEIKCRKCGKTNDKDVSQLSINDVANQTIQVFLSDLFQMLVERFTNKIETFRGMYLSII